MLGLGNYNHFEAQLPITLEAIASPDCDGQYDFELIEKSGKPSTLDLRIMLRQILADIRDSEEKGIISAKFHNTIASRIIRNGKISCTK